MWPHLASGVLGPVLKPPRHPIAMASLGIPGLLPATLLARWLFGTTRPERSSPVVPPTPSSRSTDRSPRALGCCSGSPRRPSAGRSPVVGRSRSPTPWSPTCALGGEVECDRPVNSWDDLPTARAVLFDTSPTTLLRVAGDRISSRYASKLRRFRHGPGSFKLDLAIDGPSRGGRTGRRKPARCTSAAPWRR